MLENGLATHSVGATFWPLTEHDMMDAVCGSGRAAEGWDAPQRDKFASKCRASFDFG